MSVYHTTSDLSYIDVNSKIIFDNLSPEELTTHTLVQKEGILTSSGALAIKTGAFTGRSPKDRFIVKDEVTTPNVDWNNINQPIASQYYDALKKKLTAYLSTKSVYVQDGIACSDDKYAINIRLISEKPWGAQFVYNMFLRPSENQSKTPTPDWHILFAPGFLADPSVDGVNRENFAIINFSEKTILIGGTGYTGEIKKGIFSVLNYLLPTESDVLSMHCSANVDNDGDTALFFGLSGTGKTTLSTDKNRALVGDDEHAWTDEGVFNIEGGCYAKCINLDAKKEPEIFKAIKPGAILENICFHDNSNEPNYADDSITENTRVSYPIYHIDNICEGSKASHPKHIFFLTCDAYGVLPPISQLTREQAIYHFISGYTCKIAGTEYGITEPTATFSTCFGAPFLPLAPIKYGELLAEKMETHGAKVWLVNTGWTGGSYPSGSRISLAYTRAIINAVLNDEIDMSNSEFITPFELQVPRHIDGVPADILNPKNTWSDGDRYDQKVNKLMEMFDKNATKYLYIDDLKMAHP